MQMIFLSHKLKLYPHDNVSIEAF